MKTCHCFALVFTLCFIMCAQAFSQPAPAFPVEDLQERQKIERLVQQLRSPNYRERQSAIKQLSQLENAWYYIRPLLKNTDADLAQSAEIIGKAYEPKRNARDLARIVELGNSGSIDRMLDAIVFWEGDVKSKEFREPVAKILNSIAERAAKHAGGEFAKEFESNTYNYEFLQVLEEGESIRELDRELVMPKRSSPSRTSIARGIGISFPPNDEGIEWGVAFSTGSYTSNGCAYSGVLARKSFHCSGTGASLIICDGDAICDNIHGFSIIIARGNIASPQLNPQNIVIAGGKIGTLKDINKAIDSSAFIQAGAKKPMNFIHWFEITELGVELDSKANPIRITKVIPKGIFEKAGFRSGDELLAFNGKKVATLEECTDQLRRASIADKVWVKFQRGKETQEIAVSLKLD